MEFLVKLEGWENFDQNLRKNYGKILGSPEESEAWRCAPLVERPMRGAT